MSTEKIEGAEQTCSKCGTELICAKVIKEWQGKKEEKLQWQNKSNRKAHFKFAGPNNYKCVPPEGADQETQQPTSDEFLKQKQKEITEQQQKKESVLDSKKSQRFNEKQILEIDCQLDILMVIENIVTTKLQGSDTTPPNPAKVGMFLKIIYDVMMKDTQWYK